MTLRQAKADHVWIINPVGQVEQVPLEKYASGKINGVPARCGVCGKHATGIDDAFPYVDKGNRCVEHLNP